MNEREAHQSLQSPAKASSSQTLGTQSSLKPPSTQLSHKLGNLNLSCNISDEKLLTAAAQLVDVYNKRSKASAIITVQPKTVTEPPRIRNTNTRKQGSRSQFPLPVSNFVVTKITEKSPSTVLSKCSSIKLTTTGTLSPPSEDVKPIRCKQEESGHTKRLAEVQRQKSLQIFNTYAPNSVKNLDGARQKLNQTKSIVSDGRRIQVKTVEISPKTAPSSDAHERNKIIPSTSKAPFGKAVEASKPIKTEPVILNFRTKMHDQMAKQPVTLPKNGQTNSGCRMLEITPLSKNVLGRSTLSTSQSDRSIASKSTTQSNHIKSGNKAVRPPQQPASVTRVYSRYPLNNTSRSTYYNCSMAQRARAPIPKKYPSMSDLLQKQSNPASRLRAFDLSKTFKRSNSCVALGDKNNTNFFDHILAHSKESDKLYDLCATVVNKLAYKAPIVTLRRKRGRPRKKVYVSITRELLNSADFSLREDIWRLHQHPFADRNLNSRRNRRFALLSIEPILPDISELNIYKGREYSAISSFHTNRIPLKTYSRANLNKPRATLDIKPLHVDFGDFTERKSQIQLLNIEPLSSTSKIEIVENAADDEVSQSTEYIDENYINTYEYDLSEPIYVEYLDENDEIESPAYEPHTSEPNVKPIAIITGEADTTVENYNQQHHQLEDELPPQQHRQQTPLRPPPLPQQTNWDRDVNRIKKSITHKFRATRLLNQKGSPHIEIKYLHTNESDAHSTTDSITEIFPICEREEDTGLTVLPHILPKHKADLTLSPTRKSTRKRKIPNEFPNFAKKVRS